MSTNPMKLLFFLIPAVILFSSCSTTDPLYDPYTVQDPNPTLTKSLFPSDQEIMDQSAIDTILNSEIVIPEQAKVALINFPISSSGQNSVYGYGYWRSEDYLKLQQSYIDTLTAELNRTDQTGSLVLLPSMLTPSEPTLPVLREAAVRLQSQLMIVFTINSDIYQEFRLFRGNKAKAFATVEMVLFDVRTGIIPFTVIVTEEYETTKNDSDSNSSETMKRAEQEATLKALIGASRELRSYFSSL